MLFPCPGGTKERCSLAPVEQKNVAPLPRWSKRTKTHPAQAGVDLHQPILECWSLVQPLLECCACSKQILECWPLLRLRSKVLPRYRGLRDRPGDPQEGRSEERR